jgi:hypothetical protein
MKEIRSIYNTEPLLNEVELVIKNGLNKILSKTLERYELLERTHKQLMKLPSIREELNNDNDSCSDSDSDSVSDSESSYSDTKLNTLKQQYKLPSNKDDLLNVERKIDSLEKKYLNLYGLMDKLIDKIEVLNNKVDKMVCEPKPISNISIKPSVESSIISACQNENIKVDIDSDIEDLDDSSSNVKPINLPIIVKKMEAEESAIEVESVEDDKVVEEEDTESVEDVEEEEEEEQEEEVVEAEEVVEKAVSEVVEEEEEEEDTESVEEEEEEEEVVEEAASVETETKEEEEASDAEEEEQAESEQEKDDEEEELFEIDIDDVTYCTNDEENGSIYELKNGDVGDKVGYFKEGEPFFYADEN